MYAVRNWLIAGCTMLALATTPADSRAKNMPDSIALGFHGAIV